MNLLIDAWAWIIAPEQWSGRYSLPTLLLEQLGYTFAAVGIAALIAVPIGWAIGHTGKGREVAVAVSGAARAIPSFGLLILLVLVIGVTRRAEAALITFVLLAIPSLLAGAYTGLQAIDRATIDAARAMGMTRWQILWRVEVPLGLPLLVGGLRTATLQVVATVTIAAYVNLGGLGFPIIQGLPLRAFDQVLAGSILVALLALVLDGLLALLQRAAVPRGQRATKTRRTPSDTGPRSAQTPARVPDTVASSPST
ncbi:MAG: ABC transporter permease [Actinobacteria bacterium]|jgi:osmoprotectant transport system permease protein|uniref:ABC transporter permease n=1 Tax=unclassified Microbacterium TaxID=2609290 RepID=UPI000C55939A|nr:MULTISPECIES: ABC transporter permease subunit [unclassified Microbacterium]RUA26749.1 MAG: ABC transporter permease [Actinomycetota bacterium]MBU20375.1 glycine/betaine ABC transporter permease [Microbacterium sp.]RCL91204.1 MAG: ABC transporter permease subunit [Microbacterium sp.]HAJ18201.1 glycine/betaine ABC transporter permease [Microbacterium sp.]HAM13836.1 glycine/betaine ABC transporter permease [Microbacterium sp.]|tara:strand:+ start:5579 stop:6340 length:762 start_codon:yes stop_codon:yes gene_type:complete